MSLLDAREPVAEAAANAGEDGVDPERLLVEERALFNAQLPQPCGHAWMGSVGILVGVQRPWQTYRARSRKGPCGPL